MSDNQVIPEAAVEAAAVAWAGEREWRAHSEAWQCDRLEDARLALEAATPPMLAVAWDEGWNESWNDGAGSPKSDINPYRIPRG